MIFVVNFMADWFRKISFDNYSICFRKLVKQKHKHSTSPKTYLGTCFSPGVGGRASVVDLLVGLLVDVLVVFVRGIVGGFLADS